MINNNEIIEVDYIEEITKIEVKEGYEDLILQMQGVSTKLNEISDIVLTEIKSTRDRYSQLDNKLDAMNSQFNELYGEHRIKISYSKVIDALLEQAGVLREYRKEAREFVKKYTFIDGKWQNEKVDDVEITSGKQYRDISYHITYAINKCKEWHKEWFEVELTRAELIKLREKSVSEKTIKK